MSIFNFFILQKTYPQTEIYTLSCIKERKSLKQPFFNLTARKNSYHIDSQ